MGNDINDISKQLKNQTPTQKTLEAFSRKIGSDLLGLNRHFNLNAQDTYVMGGKVIPTYDLSHGLNPDEILTQNMLAVTSVTGTTTLDIAAPQDKDEVYYFFSYNVTVARALDLIILSPGASTGINVMDQKAAATAGAINKTVLPIFVPAQFSLRVSFPATLNTDTITISFMKFQRPRGLGLLGV